MFLTIVFGVLKFFGLAFGAALAFFLINVCLMIYRGNGGTVKMSGGYYALGLIVSMAFHLIKWSI